MIIKYCKATLLLLMVFAFEKASSQITNGQQPVTFSVHVPDREAKQSVAVEVLFKTQPGWYIYAPTGTNTAQGMIETTVNFILPEGITRNGKLKLPEPSFKNGYEIYEGANIRLMQPLKFSPGLKAGDYEVTSRITWQACSSTKCLPPMTDETVTIIHYTPN